MFLASLLRRIAFSYYDYKAYNFNIEKQTLLSSIFPTRLAMLWPSFLLFGRLNCIKLSIFNCYVDN